jgi:hypothetical protein
MLYENLPSPQEHSLISQAMEPPMSVKDYKQLMLTSGGYADACVLLCFARFFNTGITVIGPTTSYTFLADGTEVKAEVDGTHWVAYSPGTSALGHYYAILREESKTRPGGFSKALVPLQNSLWYLVYHTCDMFWSVTPFQVATQRVGRGQL